MAVSLHSSHIQKSSKNGKQCKCPSIGKYLYSMSSCNRALPRNKKKQTADTSNSVDENSLKRIHTMWFHLHGTLEKSNWLPWWLSGKESTCQHRRCDFSLWSRKTPWRKKCNPFQCSFLQNSTDREAWWATVHGVPKSQTRLKDWTIAMESIVTESRSIYLRLAGRQGGWSES